MKQAAERHLLKDRRPEEELSADQPEQAGAGEALEFMARQADQYEKLIYKTDVH